MHKLVNRITTYGELEMQTLAHEIASQRSLQQLQDIDNGVGYSSDKVLARYFETTRKTIWLWSKEGTLPKPHKIGRNTTRWMNSEIKALGWLS